VTAPRGTAEVLAFLGTALILGATALLISRAWDDLGTVGRPLVVGAGAIVLLIVGWQVGGSERTHPTRRLSATLLAGGAVAGAGAVGLTVRAGLESAGVRPGLAEWVTGVVACAVVLALCWGGYRRSRSALGLLLLGAAGALLIVATNGLLDDVAPELPLPLTGPLLCVLGGAWLARAGAAAEPQVARSIGVALLIIGVQASRGTWPEPVIPVVLLLLGGGLLLAYVRGGRAWPVLAGGVLACILGIVELLVRYAEGAGLLIGGLLAGIVLLGAGLFLQARRR